MNPEKEARGVIRSGLLVIGVGAVALVLWGFWAPLSGAGKANFCSGWAEGLPMG